jgi:hypothetical protein
MKRKRCPESIDVNLRPVFGDSKPTSGNKIAESRTKNWGIKIEFY